MSYWAVAQLHAPGVGVGVGVGVCTGVGVGVGVGRTGFGSGFVETYEQSTRPERTQ